MAGSDLLFDSWVTRTLKIRYPILMGGMMWLGRANLVAPVVRAGATGFLSALTFPDPQKLRDEIQRCRDLAQSDRFGVNLYISNHQDSDQDLRRLVDVVCDMEVPFVETSGARPNDLIPPLKQAGVKILHKVPTVRHGKSAAKLGVDAVILVGAECGGHPGPKMVGSFVQGAQGAQEIPLPVILGGGIGHGSQVTAAFAMGCEGVLIGTRMMAAKEAIPHEAIKARVAASDGTNTVVVQSIFNHHHRVLSNDATQKVLELERQGVADFETYRPLVEGSATWEAIRSGDYRRGMIDMGQSACFVNQVDPAGTIIANLVTEAYAALEKLGVRQ
ncbi:2-nitropropane dioxygenase [Leisingera sp. ANG-M1]|nr:2-nitropropane dioxygenase [Leisingera sp. ANG-M1]